MIARTREVGSVLEAGLRDELAGRIEPPAVLPADQRGSAIGAEHEREPGVRARVREAAQLIVIPAALEKQRALFAADRASALKLLTVGDSPRNEKLNVVEHAALAAVCLMMLNLDEALNK